MGAAVTVGLRHLRGGGHERPAQPRDGGQSPVPRESPRLDSPHACKGDGKWLTTTRLIVQGISDTPAWIVAKANLYARLTGKTPFVIYQGAWSILQRDFERDILPMARSEGAHSHSPQAFFDRAD